MASGAERGLTWRINRAVRRSATMPPPSRLIMFVLSDIADAGTAETPPQHTPSLAQLAAETGQSLATVKRHLAELESDGWVERIRPSEAERVRRARTRYRLHVPVQGSVGAVQSSDTALPDTGHGSDAAQWVGSDTAHRDTEEGSHRADRDGTRLTVTPDTALSDTEHGSQRAIHKEDTQTPQHPTTSPATAHADASTNSRTPRAKKPDPLERFEDFWKIYPRRKDPGHAKKAWTKAVTAGTDPQLIIDGAIRYALECRMKEPTYIKYPATWLNGECWDDEPDREHTPPAIGAPSEAAAVMPTRSAHLCRSHLLPQPCRACADDAKASRDDPWQTAPHDPNDEPPF